MRITKTIELNHEEHEILAKAMGIIDNIADASGKSMDNVFQYLIDNSQIINDYTYHMDSTIMIDDI